MQIPEVISKLRAETGTHFHEEFFNYCFKEAIKLCISECRDPVELMNRIYKTVDAEIEFTGVLHAADDASQEEVKQKTDAMLLMISTAAHIAIAIEKQLMEQIEAEAEVAEISEEFSTEGVEVE